MTTKESNEERKERFKAISISDKKAVIRAKMKAEGLEEGSSVSGKDLSSYDRDEVWDLIQVTSCFPEMQTKTRTIKAKAPSKKKAVIAWILIALALTGGMVLYYRQYPSPETRRELSADGMFAD